MSRTTWTSALVLGLCVAACAQDGTEPTSYEADRAAVTPEPHQEEVVETASADEAYGTVQEEPTYGGEYEAEPGTISDSYENGYASSTTPSDDPIGDELAGLDGATSASMPATEDEVVFRARDDFAMADTDGSGTLSRVEYVATMTPIGDPNEVPVGQGDASYEDEDLALESEVETTDPDASEYLIAKFEKVAGSDEELTLEELEDATRRDFAEADEDGDAVLSDTEMETFMALREGRSAERDL